MRNLDALLSDAWSGKCVFCILWELTLPPTTRSRTRSISRGNVFKDKGSGNLIPRYRRNLKLSTRFVTDPEALKILTGNEHFYDAFLRG